MHYEGSRARTSMRKQHGMLETMRTARRQQLGTVESMMASSSGEYKRWSSCLPSGARRASLRSISGEFRLGQDAPSFAAKLTPSLVLQSLPHLGADFTRGQYHSHHRALLTIPSRLSLDALLGRHHHQCSFPDQRALPLDFTDCLNLFRSPLLSVNRPSPRSSTSSAERKESLSRRPSTRSDTFSQLLLPTSESTSSLELSLRLEGRASSSRNRSSSLVSVYLRSPRTPS